MSNYPALDLTPYWASLNDDLITITDAIPDDKLNWTPKPELWNFRGILLHIASARDGWLGNEIADRDTAKSDVDLPWQGKSFYFPKSFFLVHAIEHAVEHRTEIRLALASAGVATPDLDAWKFSEAQGYG